MPVSRNCNYCGTRFTSDVLRRVFCSDKCKTRYHRENHLTCFYCAELASSKDHVFPQKYGDGAGDTVPACGECNSTLNASFAESIERRIIFLYAQYVKKYQLDKQIPEWADDELNELGHSLRSAVSSRMRERQRALERLVHMKARFRFLRAK